MGTSLRHSGNVYYLNYKVYKVHMRDKKHRSITNIIPSCRLLHECEVKCEVSNVCSGALRTMSNI